MESKKKAAKKATKKKSSGQDEKTAAEPRKRRSVKKRSAQRVAAETHDGRARPAFPVVGIGGSAGGLDAFKKFLSRMPSDSGIGIVLVPHLDPTHESLMVELLARQTRMPICEAEHGMVIEPDHVYVIPPNHYLGIRKGTLRLSAPAEQRGQRTAIDTFFRSLASELAERAIGIVLSGTSSHGTPGLREIKLAGGMVMAQEPTSAQYDQMPKSAVATGLVDYVLPPEDMPAALVSYVRHAYVDGVLEPEAAAKGKAIEQLNRILALLRTRTKYDFRSYRRNMLIRRIQRRMGLCHLTEVSEYVDYLRANPHELTGLYKDLLIGVTSFFREPEAFQVLDAQVIPELVSRTDDGRPLRVWVPGCSTGEEAYTLAMLITEAFASVRKSPNVQIFATDIDEDALESARQGIYPESIAADLSPGRVARFFSKTDDHHYLVNKQLRESIVFASQNLISDAPFSKLDLISCRNVLIYLHEDVQVKIIRMFHFALNEDGVLLLGPSESVGRAADLFEPLSKKWRVFRRIGPVRRDLVEIPIVAIPERRLPLRRVEPVPAIRFDELAQHLVLDQYAPASALINRQYEILSVSGPLANFLEFPRSRITKDMLAMARKGLRAKIRATVHHAMEENRPVTDTDARVKRGGGYVACSVSVRPVLKPKQAEGLLLVTFEDRPTPDEAGLASSPVALEQSHEARFLNQLEYDLKSTREDLQSTIEEYESANEDLKASNEEVMSMNEELQSANEELETSKEELQSLNEELATVNNQLSDKVDELDKANADMTNLLASTDIATMFLDRELRVGMFTPITGKLLNLVAADIGRPISDFSSSVRDESLVPDARCVLEELAPVEKEILSDSNECYLRRVVPYRSFDNRIEGVVVSYVDITRRKRDEESLRELNARLEARVSESTIEAHETSERLRAVVETANEAIITTDRRGIIESFNPAAERMFGYTKAEAIGENVAFLMPSPYREEHDGYIARYLETGEAHVVGVGREVEGRRKDGITIPLELSLSEVDHLGLFTGILRDITDRERAEAVVKDTEARLRALTAKLLTVQEEERRHVSRELHDVIGQKLTLLRMQIDRLAEDDAPPSFEDEGRDRLREIVDALAEHVRDLSHQLHPSAVEHLGLVVALRKECDTVAKASGWEVHFRSEDDVPRRPPLPASMCLYRVAQEALQNAIKHSGGGGIDVSLESVRGGVQLSVVDSGHGFETDTGRTGLGLGLVSMEERARVAKGEFEVESVPGDGTRVRCWVPLPVEDDLE